MNDIAGSYETIVLVLAFWGHCLYFHSRHTSLHSQEQCWRLLFFVLSILINTYSALSLIALLTRLRWNLSEVLICISLLGEGVEHVLHSSLFFVFSEKHLLNLLTHLLTGLLGSLWLFALFCFWYYILEGFLNPLSEVQFTNIFSNFIYSSLLVVSPTVKPYLFYFIGNISYKFYCYFMSNST